MAKKTIYHITDKEHAAAIRKAGYLKAGRGENVARTDDMAGVYICDWQSVPYWQLILGKDTVLQLKIDTEKQKLITRTYSCYQEYVSGNDLPFLEIIDVSSNINHRNRIKANTALCKAYLWMLNDICLSWARYYHQETSISGELLAEETDTLFTILNRLDYEHVKDAVLREEMEDMIESCCYAFTDQYWKTDKRLWEQLTEYGEDAWMDIRKKLRTFVEENLSSISDTDTGGWMPA